MGSNPTLAAHILRRRPEDTHQVSNPALRPEDQQRFVLRATPPLRAYLISAVGSIVGAVLIVGWQSGWPLALGIVGLVVGAFAVLLAVTATVLTRRFQSTLTVARDTLTLTSGRRRTVFSWRDIAEINVKGARLIVSPVGGGRPAVAYINPRQVAQPSFQAVGTLLAERLDASRGYHVD
ncbi:MAG TPA: hypothetical protein VIT65_06950 [Microlunatus sp.]